MCNVQELNEYVVDLGFYKNYTGVGLTIIITIIIFMCRDDFRLLLMKTVSFGNHYIQRNKKKNPKSKVVSNNICVDLSAFTSHFVHA